MNKVICSMCLLVLVACAAPPPGAFVQKADAPQTGSHIRRARFLSDIPMDKSYAQLSAEQQALVRALYSDLPADAEPPFPKEGMGAITTELEKAMRVIPAAGVLVAVANVDAAGVVQSVSFYKTPSQDMAQAVSRILVSTPFKPGLCAGQPCAMTYPLRLVFER